jgi:uncharacterized protein (TIGR02266 family)
MTDPEDPNDEGGDDGADKRRHERRGVLLRVDYDGADDLLGDFTENLSTGGTFVVTTRELEQGTEVRLVLSFPGLLQPITVDGVVRWSRRGLEPGSGIEPGVGIEFTPGPAKDHLGEIVERLRRREPGLIKRVLKVLVVEDNPHVAELIREGLRGSSRRDLGSDLSFVFSDAHNGREALELLRSDTFDAMIVDIYLPIIDGAQVIAAVRNELNLPNLPIIAVSAGGESARTSALAAGANIFLDKPMRLRQVIETMRGLMKL